MQGRTLKILLAVSIAANIFLVGAAIGVTVAGVRMFRDRFPGRPPAVWQATQALPESERAMLRQGLRETAQAAAPHLRAARAARREAAELIARPDYDPIALKAALERARTAEQKAREEVDAAMVLFLPKLSPEQRALMARGLASGRLGGGRGGGGFGRRGFDGQPPSPPPGPPPAPPAAPD